MLTFAAQAQKERRFCAVATGKYFAVRFFAQSAKSDAMGSSSLSHSAVNEIIDVCVKFDVKRS